MADLAAEIPAYGALAIAAGAFLWGEHRYRSTRKAKRAAGPLPDTRAALEAARKDFDHIIGRGGQSTSFFLDDARRENGRRLRDLAARTEDHALAARLVDVSLSWDNAWSYASPPRGARMINLEAPPRDSPADVERRRRNELQVEVARDGQEKCQTAIDRLNELERDVPQ